MKAIFTQDIYHYNHKSWVDGLMCRGWDVKVLVRLSGFQGNFEYENEIPKSQLSKPFQAILSEFTSDTQIKRRFTIPVFNSLYSYLQKEDPDVIIVKRYTVISLYCLVISELLNIPAVVYDQYPAYGKESRKRKTFRNCYSTLSSHPYYRITPVKGDPAHYAKIPNSIYVPFGIDAGPPREPESYFSNGKSSILFVGKLRQQRKRHMMFIKLIERLLPNYDIDATIAGSYSGENPKYYESLIKYVKENSLTKCIKFKENVPNSEMDQIYRQHDLFILTSRDEPAAYSPLEAMAQGLPVICSDTNGTRCYINHGQNGYVFNSDSFTDLIEKTELLLNNKNNVIKMGNKSQELVVENHNPTNLADKLVEIV